MHCTQGHWKFHIGFDLKNCNIEKAFDTLLLKMEEHQISSAKIVAPYRNVNSMEGREFTGYLKEQGESSKNQIQNFLRDVEYKFKELGIAGYSTRDRANKSIKNSMYTSYRNDRARVIVIKWQGGEFTHDKQEIIEEAIQAEPYQPYLRDSTILTLGDVALFVREGKLVMQDGRSLRKFRELMDEADIPMKDGAYISAEAAEKLADWL